MSKRDYQAIADAVRESRRTGDSQYGNGPLRKAEDRVTREIATRIADYCAKDNPLFRRDLFLKACEVSDV